MHHGYWHLLVRLWLNYRRYLSAILFLFLLAACDMHSDVAPIQLTATPASPKATATPVLPMVTPSPGAVHIDISDRDIFALRATTGEQDWRYTADAALILPVVSANVAYTISRQGSVYALRISDGVLLWHHAFGQAGYGEITATPSTIYVNFNVEMPIGTLHPGTLYAFDADTGTLLWHDSADTILALPLIATDNMLFMSTGKEICAIEARSGAIRWRYPVDGSIVNPPQLEDGNLYIATSNNVLQVVEAESGMLLWTKELHTTLLGPLIVWHDIIYVTSRLNDSVTTSTLNAFSSENGRTLWQQPLAISSTNVHLVSDNTGVIYISAASLRSGDVYALWASDGGIIWHYALKHSLYIFVVADGLVYVKGTILQDADNAYQTAIYALQTKDGALRWTKTTSLP